MSFNTYQDYIESSSSEKITIAIIKPRKSINSFTNLLGNVWTLEVGNIISDLLIDNVSLVSNVDSSVTIDNPWFFDIPNNTLYYYTVSTSPDDDDLVAQFNLYYSNVPLNIPYDLTDGSYEVSCEPRLNTSLGFKSEIGQDGRGISISGSGNLSLENSDGYFDNIISDLVWENKEVDLYSFNRELPISEISRTYKGFITNKSFSDKNISFKVNDAIFKLDNLIPMNLFTEDDGVNQSFIGNVKRNVFGKVDGLLCRSIDQVSNSGYLLSGTVSGTASNSTITGSGTSFLQFIAQNDRVLIGESSYDIEIVESGTQLVISNTDGLDASFTGSDIYVIPTVPSPEFNRTFFVADHAVKQSFTEIVNMSQLNRLEVLDISGFEVGDSIKINDDEVFSIFGISGNLIQLNINASEIYPASTTVSKEPITEIFIKGESLSLDNLESIVNVDLCTFTINNTAEFVITPNKIINEGSFGFTNGSRIITYSGTGEVSDKVRERDWLKISSEADSRYIRVVDIVGNSIRCATPYTGSTASGQIPSIRRPDYISDSSEVSVNCLGKTQDGLSTGDLLSSGSDIVRSLLISLGLEDSIDSDSFDTAAVDNSNRLSIALPYSIKDSPPKIRDIINDINTSVFSSLSLKKDFTLAYNINSPERLSTSRVISDADVIKWTAKGTNNTTFKSLITRYRDLDYSNLSNEASNSVIRTESSNVIKFNSSDKEKDISLKIYSDSEALESSERFLFHNEQILTEIKIKTDLRLDDIELADTVILDFERLKNIQVSGSNINYFKVISISKNGNSMDMTLTNLGGLYSRGSIITEDDANDYIDAGNNEKSYSSYMTDDNGLITSSPETKNKNLIS